MDANAIEMARHPAGEQVPVEEWVAVADTFGGRVRVEESMQTGGGLTRSG
jgi:hypothetical protein